MIKLYFTLIVAGILTAGLSSCEKENDTVPASLQNSSLIGKWYLKNQVMQTAVDTSAVIQTVSSGSVYTANDYFEFKADNVATYASTTIGKVYNGYYSCTSNTAPAVLTFKSGLFTPEYNVGKISKDTLLIYDVRSTTTAKIKTTITYSYIYTHSSN